MCFFPSRFAANSSNSLPSATLTRQGATPPARLAAPRRLDFFFFFLADGERAAACAASTTAALTLARLDSHISQKFTAGWFINVHAGHAILSSPCESILISRGRALRRAARAPFCGDAPTPLMGGGGQGKQRHTKIGLWLLVAGGYSPGLCLLMPPEKGKKNQRQRGVPRFLVFKLEFHT